VYLQYICPRCWQKGEPGDIYCANCGSRLPEIGAIANIRPSSEKKIITAESPKTVHIEEQTVAERRTVTVLFADLSGFTSMSEKLDPEDVTTVMNECLQIMGDTVTAYGGYIDKFIGDCIMALFGAPITHENDPELAIRAALDMRHKIEEYNKKLPVKLEKPLGLHIGINTGLVVAGKMGSDARMDYTVMGDTVNLASRLESNALVGQIFVSSRTYNQAKHLFEFIEKEPISVKGKVEPVGVYEVVRVLDISEIKASSVSELPLVGRIKEIESLSSSVKRLQEGEGQSLFLISDPGFGKSRVQVELKNRFKKEDIQIIEGRCLSYGKNSPYHTFSEIFKRIFAIEHDDMAVSIVEKLSDGLPLLVGEDRSFLTDEAKKGVVFIGKLLGVELSSIYDIPLGDMSPQEIHTSTIRSISWFFSALGRRKATVLSIEDTHNADSATIEAIASLISVSKSSPLMLLLMIRPDKSSSVMKLLPLARRVLGDRSIEVSFERLNRDECESLVKYLLGAEKLPKELMELVGLRSDGNPLFLQEIVRSLLEQKAIAKEGENIIIKKDLSTTELPNSIAGLIIARFDNLTPLEKEIISKASVLGYTFSRRLIEAIMDGEDIGGALESLIESEMIFESQSFPEIIYSFHTTFIQEAVYDTLLLKRRQSLHKEAAETIRNVFGERLQDYIESLATHYLEAGDMKNAYDFTIRSGQKAKAVYANEVAAKFYEQAIDISSKLEDSLPKSESIYKPYSEVLELLGNMERAIWAWERVLEEKSDTLEKANAMRNIGRIEEKRGAKDKSIKIYQEALALIDDFKESKEYGELLNNLSWVLNRYKKGDEAIETGLRALAIFEKLELKQDIALCCNNLAVFYENMGDFEKALSYNLRSHELFMEAKNRRQIANIELSLGYLRTKTGENELALKHFTRSAEIMDMIGSRPGSAAALLAKGRLYADIGRHDDAKTALLAALSDFKEADLQLKVSATLVSLIQVLLEQKEVNEAYIYLDEGLMIAKENSFASEEGKLNRLYARADKIADKPEEAKKRYEEAIAIFEKLGREGDVASVKKEMGEVES